MGIKSIHAFGPHGEIQAEVENRSLRSEAVRAPRIIIHGNRLDRVPESYKRYLEGFFRGAFELVGTPLAIEFRTGRNPYAKKRR